jgi:hypothetical protein
MLWDWVREEYLFPFSLTIIAWTTFVLSYPTPGELRALTPGQLQAYGAQELLLQASGAQELPQREEQWMGVSETAHCTSLRPKPHRPNEPDWATLYSHFLSV